VFSAGDNMTVVVWDGQLYCRHVSSCALEGCLCATCHMSASLLDLRLRAHGFLCVSKFLCTVASVCTQVGTCHCYSGDSEHQCVCAVSLLCARLCLSFHLSSILVTSSGGCSSLCGSPRLSQPLWVMCAHVAVLL
jgi:hypothetical protein